MEIILKGVFIGFVIAFPVGPVAALCLRITIAHGLAHGALAALGAASADAIFGAIAAFGLTQTSDLLTEHQLEIRAVGVIVMLALATRLYSAPPIDPSGETPHERPGFFGPYITTLFLTLANPVTLIAFAGVLAAAGVHEMGLTFGQGLILTGSVFGGAALCWLSVAGLSALFRGKVNAQAMRGINFVTATMMVIFASLISVSVIAPKAIPFLDTPEHIEDL